MLTFPAVNPIAFSLGIVKVHWYGLMYLLAFALAWLLGHWRVKYFKLNWQHEDINDLIFYAALGVIIGGRLGYMLFYNTQQLLLNPLSLFKIWQGGMSFHGGLAGVIIALIILARKLKKPFWQVADFTALLVPLGLAAGRLGNFINGELWGRPANVPWAMIFPAVDNQPRHPSQLYEFALEGVVLFIIMWIYAAKPRPPGRTAGLFLIGYGISRMIVEFFRQPDTQLGFIAFDWLTMGQLLSLPMLIVGFWLWRVKR